MLNQSGKVPCELKSEGSIETKYVKKAEGKFSRQNSMCKVPVAGMWYLQGSDNKASRAKEKETQQGMELRLFISSYIYRKLLKDFKQGRKSFTNI